MWLKANHPDYKDIEISERNLAQYPEHGGDLEGILTVDDGNIELDQREEDVNTRDDEFLNAALDEFEFKSKDMPRVSGIVPEVLERETIEKCVQNALDDHLKDKTETSTINMPTTGLEPEKEYMPGFFRKAFPHLFPF